MSSRPSIENALQRMDASLAAQNAPPPFSVDQLLARAHMVQDAIERRMTEGVHYGVIPGTRRKALLKPGAEALADLFHLRSIIVSNVIEYPDEHREVRATCSILFQDATLVQRSAICTTRETKYRFRSENTGAMVPNEYWQPGTMDYKNPALLGGPDFFPRKVDGHWLIFHQIATTNLADHYHTVGAMAEKRAFVAAVIAALAASDALVTEDDQTYRQRSRQPSQDRSTHHRDPQQGKPGYDPTAESTDRALALKALLEGKAEAGVEALMEAWGGFTEADRKAVGADFGRIKRLAEHYDRQRAMPENEQTDNTFDE